MLFLYCTVLFAFYACKKDTNNILNGHKTKPDIIIYKSLGKSKDNHTYANTMQTFKGLHSLKAELLRFQN